MKCSEKLVVNVLKEEVKLYLDPFQFAYKAGQGTEDAINCISHLVNRHLEDTQAYACLLGLALGLEPLTPPFPVPTEEARQS